MDAVFQMPKSDGSGLYQVPEDYEAFLGADGSDEAWYLGLAQAGDAVLDLGCGAGRLSLALARQGARICGLDASLPMLAAARARAAQAGLTVEWRQGDWRRLDVGSLFDLAILPYNGLQHLLSLEDLAAFLAGVKRSLVPGGHLAMDLHLPQAALLARDPDEWFGVGEGPLSPTGWRVQAEQSRWDPALQVLTQRWQLGGPDGATRVMELPMRQYFPVELRGLLLGAGFRVLSHDGGFNGQPLGRDSLRQALVIRPEGA
jgi:SAM-dependent methyltransferase